jgi:hypothetical protein
MLQCAMRPPESSQAMSANPAACSCVLLLAGTEAGGHVLPATGTWLPSLSRAFPEANVCDYIDGLTLSMLRHN